MSSEQHHSKNGLAILLSFAQVGLSAKLYAWALLILALSVYGSLVSALAPIWMPPIMAWVKLIKGQPVVWPEPSASVTFVPFGLDQGSLTVTMVILGGLYLALGWLGNARTLYLGTRRPVQSLYDAKVSHSGFFLCVLIYRPTLVACVGLALESGGVLLPMLQYDRPLWYHPGFEHLVILITGVVLSLLIAGALRRRVSAYSDWVRGPVIGANAVAVSAKP